MNEKSQIPIEQKEKKTVPLMIRVDSKEKKAFKDAAELSGAPLSVWVRERLRQAAIKELDSIGHPIAFFKKIDWGK